VRSAATSIVALAALAPSLAQAAPSSPFRPGGDLVPRLRLNLGGPLSPSIALAVRAMGGRNDPLFGPGLIGFRAVPELIFALRPAPRLEIFAGGGLGAARVRPDRAGAPFAEELDLASFAAFGTRFTWERVPVTTTARVESVAGHGTAVTLNLRLNLDALGVPR
jgi:hypothetical protein